MITSTRRDLRAAFIPWVVARVLVGGALGLARYGFGDLEGARRPVPLDQGLFAWDAAFYREIAEHGYGALRDGLRFFPLVPLLSRGLGVLLAGNDALALLVVANVSALVFGVLLYRLALRETGDAGVAMRAAWFAALFPAATVLVMGYAEATFLAISVAMFLALRSRRWWWAALGGVFAGLTRPAAALLAVPAAIEVARTWGGASSRDRLARIGAVVSPFVGSALYLVWVGREYGDSWLPLRLQNEQQRRGGFANPVTRIIDGFGDLFGGDRFGSGLHVVWALVFVALVVVLAQRLPASYAAYGGTTVLFGLAAENLDSFERYAMSAFPLVLGLALVTGRDEVERPAIVLAGAGLVGYAVLIFLGRYVP
ncbi:MAG: hypothetical protein ACRDY4_04200 [Acidimicrobiia bacterium]